MPALPGALHNIKQPEKKKRYRIKFVSIFRRAQGESIRVASTNLGRCREGLAFFEKKKETDVV